MDDTKLQEYLEFARVLADEAGKIMNRYFRANDIETEWKEDDTPITVADSTINSLVIDRVREVYPEHGVLGEEESYKPERGLIWVVDPIDGTMPYSLGIPLSCFSLALVSRDDGQPVVAVTLDPFLSKTYYAVKGGGAYLNDEEIYTSSQKMLKKAYISLGGTVLNNDTFNMGECLNLLRADGAVMISLPSHVFFSGLVAEGSLQGRILGYGSPWDSAAVSLLVKEAGGIVTDILGKERRYDEWGNGCILSANIEIHKILLDKVKKSLLS